MKKLMKALAALMLMVAVIITAGCNKKPENPDDPEQSVTLAGIWYANDQWIGNEHDRAAMDFVNSNTVIWYGTVSTNKNAFQNMEGTALDGCAGWYYFSKTYYTYVLTDNKIFFNDRIFTIFEDYLVEDGSSSQWKPWDNGNGGGGAHATVTVTTYNPTDITSTEATCCADVTAENGSNIRELGICWGTSAYPTVENSHLSTTTWNTPFVCTISDLVPETRYHVRAYALNGTSYIYGDDKTFTTLAEGGGGGQTFTITATANPTDGGMVIGSGTYQEGQQCTLIATANSGYDFVNWTENGTEVSSDLSFTFAVNANRNVVANFVQQAPQNYTITVSANPSIGGMVSGGGTYQQGQTCTVNAIPNAGFSFVSWTENGSLCSVDERYTFMVNENRDLFAFFMEESHAPEGAINGFFSINHNDDLVYFSKGNLQYQASTNTWRFAEHQYDFVGGVEQFENIEYGNVYENGVKCSNNEISSSYNGWIDLFAWGTSGWDSGNTYYQPWDYTTNGGDEINRLYGPPGSHHLTGAYSNSDWGVYNAIINGGNNSGLWRTLTKSEWDYVFNKRNTISGILYAKANVNGVNGVILLPDDWNANIYILKDFNQSDVGYDSNVISNDQWSVLQSFGVVFLPAAGMRNAKNMSYLSNVVGFGSGGQYWSSWCYDRLYSYYIRFNTREIVLSEAGRNRGRSVRLVCPVE